jgi:hypothetical protein
MTGKYKRFSLNKGLSGEKYAVCGVILWYYSPENFAPRNDEAYPSSLRGAKRFRLTASAKQIDILSDNIATSYRAQRTRRNNLNCDP